jgi:hypothetical protein
MSGKKPDIVVWSEERGWYASELPYGSNVGAPAIRPNTEEVTLWKQTNLLKVNHHFETQFEDLKSRYLKLMEEFRWNELIYTAKYSFEPVLGETYYLYLDDEDKPYLSLINPTEWKRNTNFVGAFRLDSGQKWEKVTI